MAETSVVPRTTREQRGIALYRERGAEIERTTAHVYRVPSCSGEATYTVHLDLGFCTCPDHRRAKTAGEACKHRLAAEISAAKGRARRARGER